MDFDKEYELHEAGLNKRAKDIHSSHGGEESIKAIDEGSLADKLYRIMKFGGNMEYEDYPEEYAEIVGTSNRNVALFSKCISEYLGRCSIHLPLSFDKYTFTAYFLYSIAYPRWKSLADSLDYDKRFIESIVEDLNASGIVREGEIKMRDLKEWIDDIDYFYLVGTPNEFMYSKKKPGVALEKTGCFFLKVPYDSGADDAIHEMAVRLCNFLERVMKEDAYNELADKIEHLFDSLSKSKNPACYKAMNEGLLKRAKDKFFKDFGKDKLSVIKGVDSVYDDVSVIVDKEYASKLEELSGVETDRDLVSGILVANKIFNDIGEELKWKVQIAKVSDSDSVYFGSSQSDIKARASMFVEERFITSKIFRKLKRCYAMIKNHAFHNEVYFTKIVPEYPIMSNKSLFKHAFISYEGSPNLRKEEVKDLCYMTLSYLRENLDRSEWSLVEDKLESLANK